MKINQDEKKKIVEKQNLSYRKKASKNNKNSLKVYSKLKQREKNYIGKVFQYFLSIQVFVIFNSKKKL